MFRIRRSESDKLRSGERILYVSIVFSAFSIIRSRIECQSSETLFAEKKSLRDNFSIFLRQFRIILLTIVTIIIGEINRNVLFLRWTDTN